MYIKQDLRDNAIKLRKKGLTYSEILKKVPVAKSTLSLWFRDVKLAKKQKQILSKKKLLSAKKGSETRHKEKIKNIERIKNNARKEVSNLSNRELWLIGVALYWSEGSKEKDKRSSMVEFCNTDPYMIKFYLYWLRYFLGVNVKNNVSFCIYIHKNKKHEIEKIKKFWSRKTKMPLNKFDRVFYKKHNTKTIRENTGTEYYGTLKIIVNKSTDMNRKIAGWIEGIVNFLN
jgi:hypothetical protein